MALQTPLCVQRSLVLLPVRVSLIAMFAIALMAGFAAPQADAQLTSGTVSGTVTDPTGAMVAKATVILISEDQGTKLPEVTTKSNGEFVIPNIPPDTYTVQITGAGFKTFKVTGIEVAPGDRVALGRIPLQIGTVSSTVTVSTEAASALQTESADRSATVTSSEVKNLPLQNRNFTSLTSVIPGTINGNRAGDRSSTPAGQGADNNIMVDGVSAIDTGNNAQSVAVNTESVAEIKVLVSNYQAEYGRSSGLQLTAVTKSGTNHFHGSGFLVMRQSGWNATSHTSKLNGDPRSYLKEKDWGFSVGGPIGKPGHNNKLFFFFSEEFDPRSLSGVITRYRFPTALERAGDFSKTLDNNGNPFPYIRDASTGKPCSSSNTSGCFQFGGTLGKIDPARVYSLGQTILNLYPTPNVVDGSGNTIAGNNYNFQIGSPGQSLTSQIPVLKIDYQPMTKLRGSAKVGLWGQPTNPIKGTLPGFNDSQEYKKWYYLWASTIDYTVNPTTFVEVTFGGSRNDFTGCIQGGGGSGPVFCQSGIPTDPIASLAGANLTGLPSLFASPVPINKNYYAYQAFSSVAPPIWDKAHSAISMVPSFSWGGRIGNAPPNFPFPGYLNTNQTKDVSGSITKTIHSHTAKAGMYWNHSYKAQQRQGWLPSINFGDNTSNPIDAQYGFANAFLGTFNSYSQNSSYIEGDFVYNSIEGYLQDNWKIRRNLTLDFGLRLTYEQPQYDELGQGVNFLPDHWNQANAPVLYVAGCASAPPCTGTNRQAKDPVSGALLGPNTTAFIGTIVTQPGSTTPAYGKNFLNGLFKSGQNPVPTTTFNTTTLAPAPRIGIAYTPNRKLVLRSGMGLFYDRSAGNAVYNQIQNPPNLLSETLNFAPLTGLSTGQAVLAPPTLSPYQLNSGLPSTWTWSGGAQFQLGAQIFDFSYNGEHSYNLIEFSNINAIDFGSAYLPQNQDPTVASSALLGNSAVSSNLMRSFKGFGSINSSLARGWFTSHSVQFGVNRRFSNGLGFVLNDTVLLVSKGSTAARYQHNSDGTFAERADQAQADALLGNFVPTVHTLKGDFVYAIPSVKSVKDSVPTKALSLVTRDWQLSGIWQAHTGNAFAAGYSFADGTNNQAITGSPDYGARVVLTGSPGSGCGGNRLAEFNPTAFGPPAQGSVGLESSASYMRGCFYQQFDTSLQRSIKFGESRALVIRLDAFNTFNQAHITGVNSSVQFTSLSNHAITNLPTASTRNLPKNAGFGVANGYQGARTLQLWTRFTF
jgi:hypothetical protein